MTIVQLRTLLLYCSIINYAILIFWVFLYMGPLRNLQVLKSRWYRLTPEQFDSMNFAGIIFYKTLIIFFNLIPLIALALMG
jgi:hypothetical protein